MKEAGTYKASKDEKERRCLRCGKKVVGRHLCKRCFKLNSALDYAIGRYEYRRSTTDLS